MDVSHDASSDKDILRRDLQKIKDLSSFSVQRESSQTHQVRPSCILDHLRAFQLNIQELIHAFQRPANADLILQLDRDFVIDEGLEETIEEVRAMF